MGKQDDLTALSELLKIPKDARNVPSEGANVYLANLLSPHNDRMRKAISLVKLANPSYEEKIERSSALLLQRYGGINDEWEQEPSTFQMAWENSKVLLEEVSAFIYEGKLPPLDNDGTGFHLDQPPVAVIEDLKAGQK